MLLPSKAIQVRMALEGNRRISRLKGFWKTGAGKIFWVWIAANLRNPLNYSNTPLLNPNCFKA